MTTPAPTTSPSQSPSFAGSCSFTTNFGSGVVLVTEGLFAFNQAQGTSATCTLTCDSGSTTNLWLAYDRTPSLFDHDAAVVDITGCSGSVSFSSSVDECFVGYRIESAVYNNMVMTCSCTNLGPSSCPTPAPVVSSGDKSGSKDKSGSGDSACFSKDMSVRSKTRGVVKMKDLQEQEDILVGHSSNEPSSPFFGIEEFQDVDEPTPIYEPVFRFGHHHHTKEGDFLQFFTSLPDTYKDELGDADRAPLEITGNHLVFKLDETTQKPVSLRADAIREGDILLHGPGQIHAKVERIKRVSKEGVYMPMTPSGNIVVNGYKASAYVSNADWAPTFVKTLASSVGVDEQALFHWFTAPFRSLCRGLNLYCGHFNDEGILTYLLLGKELATMAEWTGETMQTYIVAPLFWAFFGLLNVLDYLVGPTLLVVPFWLVVRRFQRRSAASGQHAKQE